MLCLPVRQAIKSKILKLIFESVWAHRCRRHHNRHDTNRFVIETILHTKTTHTHTHHLKLFKILSRQCAKQCHATYIQTTTNVHRRDWDNMTDCSIRYEFRNSKRRPYDGSQHLSNQASNKFYRLTLPSARSYHSAFIELFMRIETNTNGNHKTFISVRFQKIVLNSYRSIQWDIQTVRIKQFQNDINVTIKLILAKKYSILSEDLKNFEINHKWYTHQKSPIKSLPRPNQSTVDSARSMIPDWYRHKV